MIIIEKIGIAIFNFIYLFIKLVPTKNKVVMISRQSDTKTLDFSLLEEKLTKMDKNIKIKILCKKLKNGYSSTMINKIKYVFHMFVQMYHIATSKVVVLDSYCIVVSILKHKKELKIIQMWHSMGTMKKFGYAILDKEEGSKKQLAKTMKMHKNYDYIFASSEAYKEHLAKGFNYKCDKILTFPLPRIDLLKDKDYQKNKKNEIIKKYPILKNKKNILYCPTFRKNEEKFENALNDLISSIPLDKYNVILKLHPLSKVKVDIKKKGIILDNSYSTFDMLSIADYVISDYSCIVYEAAIMNIPLYFYNFDMEKYLNERGLAIDYYKELPGVISKEADVIIESITKKNYDYKKLKEFSNKYVVPTKNATQNIANFVISLMKKSSNK